MKTKKSYFVHFATCSDGIMRDCQLFDRLADAKTFTTSLAYKWQIERRIDAPYTVLESIIIARSIDPNARYAEMARRAAARRIA